MYEIVSPRIGQPGAPFVPRPGVNLEALIAAGFVKQSTKSAAKGGKTKIEPDAETDHESNED